jgi:cytoskeletal protein CcmA (bactofilin family)
MGGVFVLFFAMATAPLFLGYREFRKKSRKQMFNIPSDDWRDPRYFRQSFLKRIHEALGGDPLPGIHDITLTRPEKVKVVREAHLSSRFFEPNVLFVKKDLLAEAEVVLRKECFVGGSALIGAASLVRALAAERSLSLGEGCRVARWVDANDRLTIADRCHLGARASCEGPMSLGREVAFHFLFAHPILTVPSATDQAAGLPARFKNSSPGAFRDVVPAGTQLTGDQVFSQNVWVGAGAVIKGAIKSHGDVIFEGPATVEGPVFADGDIHVGGQSVVKGSLVAGNTIYLYPGVRVGSSGEIRSVLGHEGVVLHGDVQVFGVIRTDGRGQVVA